MIKRRTIVAAMTWMLAAVFTIILLPGCSRNDAPMKRPENVNELSLVQMWDEVVKIIGIKEQTTYLDQFVLDVSYQNGKINTLRFTCYVINNEPEWTHYFIGFDEDRGLRWQSDETQEVSSEFNILLTYNPRIVFVELDKIGFSNVQSTSSGFSIRVEKEYDHAFSNDDAPGWLISHLKDGQLIPLKYIKLSSNHSSLPVWIDRGQRQKPPASPVPLDSDYVQTEIWFLSEDVARAETVEYFQN